jgi:hypothetical protein
MVVGPVLMIWWATSGPPGGQAMRADRIALVAEPELAVAVQDEEHFLSAVVAVEGALRLARRQDGEV